MQRRTYYETNHQNSRGRQKISSSAASVAGSGMGGKLLIMAALVAAVVFGVAIFFKVGRIEVQGNTIYASDKIIEASGLELGDQSAYCEPGDRRRQCESGAAVCRPGERRAGASGHGRHFRQGKPACLCRCDGHQYRLADQPSGKALERIDASLQEQYPQIIGVTLNNPTAGQTVTAVNQSALDAVLSLFSELDGTGILEHTASVNVEKEYDIVLQYDDRYEIDLGSTDRLDYKVQYLQAILKELSDFQAGTD